EFLSNLPSAERVRAHVGGYRFSEMAPAKRECILTPPPDREPSPARARKQGKRRINSSAIAHSWLLRAGDGSRSVACRPPGAMTAVSGSAAELQSANPRLTSGSPSIRLATMLGNVRQMVLRVVVVGDATAI